MARYLLTANFNVEADSDEAAEELFEDWLTTVTALDDSRSVAFECIEAVMSDDDFESTDSQADGFADETEAKLREAA